jgi:hypothetical protein
LASGRVWRVNMSSRPPVVGMCTSIICTTQKLSNTLRALSPNIFIAFLAYRLQVTPGRHLVK